MATSALWVREATRQPRLTYFPLRNALFERPPDRRYDGPDTGSEPTALACCGAAALLRWLFFSVFPHRPQTTRTLESFGQPPADAGRDPIRIIPLYFSGGHRSIRDDVR